ncbi:hypothetical protein CDD81_6658 [Ophiocordyceps australis]|uniref:Uncharacterized protein n=1 Tax=Ophiocordyceps australis TaxID=1399860 RepID=A0A2C5XHJ1_9HYPO|nr:hypothetical protein CDD81_6658 [Ophiocordyceps australis]
MHILGHHFSSRDKASKTPRDLHIRKVSLSGCSLSSDCSLSSGSTASSSPSVTSPLRAHSRSPPPPLNERPFLDLNQPQLRPQTSKTFHTTHEQEDEGYFGHFDSSDFQTQTRAIDHHQFPVTDMAHAAHPTNTFYLAARRPMPCSRWSYSTVDSESDSEDSASEADDDQDQVDDAASVHSELEEDDDKLYDHSEPAQQPSHNSMPNFSMKRAVTPRRPPIKTLDSLEDFIKRGGWKRRGIVFQTDSDGAIADGSL